MNCNEIGELLMDAASGLAPAPQVEAHVRECAGCAARLHQMRQTMTLLDEWQAPEPSPYFNTRLQARLREEAARPQGLLQWFRKPVLAAAMAALFVAGATLYTAQRPPQPANTAESQSAVQDLQDLDKNHDIFANFDVLDDLAADDSAQTANP